jgi:mannosyltransferase
VTGATLASRLRELWPVAAAAALALALGLWELGRQSFGIDEGVSAYTATQPLGEVLHVVRDQEPNNVLYFNFLFFWEKLGSSQELLRFPSVIAYAAAVPLCAAIAWRSFGRPAGVAAGFLLAINAFAVEMGQEARAYALLLALVSASTLCFMLAVERSTPRRWALWAALSALAAYAHPFALLVLVAQALSLAWLPPARVPWRATAIAGAGVTVAVLPLLALLATGDSDRISWVDPATPDNVLPVLERLLGSDGPELVYLYGALAIAMLAVVLRRRPRRSEQAWRTMLPVLWLIVPLVLAVAISLIQPMFYHRYLIVVLPAFAIVAGGVLVRLRPWPLAVAALVVLCALHVQGVLDWYESDLKEDWRGAARVIGARAAADETIFVQPFGSPALAWYLDREASSERMPGAVRRVRSIDERERAELGRTPSRLWLVEIVSEAGVPLEGEATVPLTFRGRPELEEWRLNKLRITLLGL